MRLQEVVIVEKSRSIDGRIVSAVTKTRFEFFYDGQWVRSALKSEITIRVRPHAPEQRVLKRLKATAWADACSFMDGGDVSDENIFHNI